MLESSIVYTLVRTIPESLVLVLSGMMLLGNSIDIKQVFKKGILLGTTIVCIRLLPINFGVHTMLAMISFGLIIFNLSGKDTIKTMITTCTVWIALVLSEGVYSIIATVILKIPIDILMNKEISGALITLPSLIIILILVFIFKEIKNKINKSA